MAKPIADGLSAQAELVPLSEAERLNWLRLLRCDNVGPRTFESLLRRYGSAGAALAALPGLIAKAKSARSIRIPPREEIEHEMSLIQSVGGRFLAICEPDYPPLLRHTASAPPVIAVRGNLSSLKRSLVAIVGARNASAAGLSFAAQLARGIARAGHVIVSGLARGIDGRAHEATIESGTIAVLAGGLGKIYPSEHQALVERIVANGAIISEMPYGWEARGRDFPRRNRIVAGLSRAVVVVEAARRSGSLITARFAAEAGREIFAVPGSPLDPRAEGTNDLLRDGASLCTKPEDITSFLAEQDLSQTEPGFFERNPAAAAYPPFWDELDFVEGADPPLGVPAATRADEIFGPEVEEPEIEASLKLARHSLEDIEKCLLDLLSPAPVAVDELARLLQVSARQVRTALLALKLAGKLEWHDGDLVSSVGTTGNER
ncbi:MAG TPA: DNA-processing protein DprA [Methylocella sp.]|nr:DNA-processing protein DprA [Methylocella sp.]